MFSKPHQFLLGSPEAMNGPYAPPEELAAVVDAEALRRPCLGPAGLLSCPRTKPVDPMPIARAPYRMNRRFSYCSGTEHLRF